MQLSGNRGIKGGETESKGSHGRRMVDIIKNSLGKKLKIQALCVAFWEPFGRHNPTHDQKRYKSRQIGYFESKGSQAREEKIGAHENFALILRRDLL